MRMEELSNNNYVKGTDGVERYLLNLISDYFSNSGINEDSKEYIIQKAVDRMKEELFIDNAGVVSVNGKTGVVNITIQDLGGEPAIPVKGSAFNVNFGDTAGTACEGDDPRLSDKRKPLTHTHTIQEINGLEGELSTITNTINLLDNKVHKHLNLDVLNKISYTGSSDKIDLTPLETMNATITDKINQVDVNLQNMDAAFSGALTKVTNDVQQAENDYANTLGSIQTASDQVEANVKSYCDTSINIERTNMQTAMNQKVTKSQMNELIRTMNKSFTVVYEVDITGLTASPDPVSETALVIPQDILAILDDLDGNYKVEFSIRYMEPTLGKNVESSIPFLYASNGSLQYSITGCIEQGTSIKVIATRFINDWSTFIDQAIVHCRISTTNRVSEVV